MKRLILLLPLIILLSCSCEPDLNSKDYYLDTSFVIVEKSTDEDGAFIIIRTLEQPYKYRVLHTNHCYGGTYTLSDASYDKYEIGDVISFDYLLKKEFHSKSKDILVDDKEKEKSDGNEKGQEDEDSDAYYERVYGDEEEKTAIDTIGNHEFTEPEFGNHEFEEPTF